MLLMRRKSRMKIIFRGDFLGPRTAYYIKSEEAVLDA